MDKPSIKSVEYLYEKIPSRRQLKITLSNKTVVRAEACYESWMQWGGTESELWITMPLVEANNDWLHGEGRKVYLTAIEDLHPVFGRR